MTLIERLIEAGYPEKDIHHHESDLYVYVTPLTRKVISDWAKDSDWIAVCEPPLLNIFTDNITGRKMYDVAFAYAPWWEETAK